MPPSLASENSPLLNQVNKQSNYNGDIVIEDDETGDISIVSTSPKSINEHDDLLEKRLNGSSLMVVLGG